jgi:hypothetical protein
VYLGCKQKKLVLEFTADNPSWRVSWDTIMIFRKKLILAENLLRKKSKSSRKLHKSRIFFFKQEENLREFNCSEIQMNASKEFDIFITILQFIDFGHLGKPKMLKFRTPNFILKKKYYNMSIVPD